MAMVYKTLEKLFHADASSDRMEANLIEARRRLEDLSTFRTGIDIGTGELFLASPRELSLLLDATLRMERKVSQLWRDLPGIACGAYIRNLIMDEVVSTNEMENVRSTRRQIKEALDGAEGEEDGAQKPTKQFVEFAKLYLNLIEEDALPPRTLQDIRDIYDDVVAGTLGEDDLPDGQLFRASGVDITGASQRVAHRGVEPEEKIAVMLQEMMSLVGSEDIPELYSALLSHFLFEYIHPFYDGNGRTGRYLLALYVGKPLSLPTALSLSRVIAQNKGAYYKAFSVTEDPLNHGEGTFFVLQMMQLIRDAQDDIVSDLNGKRAALDEACEKLDAIEAKYALSEQAIQILFQVLQVALFGAYNEVPLRQMATHIGFTAQTARKYTRELENAGLIVPVALKPLAFELTDKGKREFGLDLLLV